MTYDAHVIAYQTNLMYIEDTVVYHYGHIAPRYPMPATMDLMPAYYFGLDSVFESTTNQIHYRQWQDECKWLDTLTEAAWLDWYHSQ